MSKLRIGDICNIRTGKLDANAACDEGAFPFFTCAKKPLRINSYSFDCECVLLAGNGDFNVNIYNGKFDAYQRTYVIEVKNKECFLTKYLYYILKNKIQHFRDVSNGGIIKFIKLGDITDIEVPDLTIDEQIDLVNKFDLCEKIIEENERQIELYNESIYSYFYDKFGDPILNNKNMPVVKLSEICTKITNGTTPKGGSVVYKDKGILFIRSQNVWNNDIRLKDIAYIDESINKTMLDSCLNHGDILITKTGRFNTENSSLGRSAIFDGEDGSANINGHVYMVRLKKEINRRYILAILLSEQYHEYIRKVCVGGTDKRQLNKNHIEDFPILFPDFSLQKQFGDFALKIDSLVTKTKNLIDYINEIYSSLLDKYLDTQKE